ncbi:hypothetical protein GEMRC1_007043 [Eukaryota sp. GEM-RC1]
MRVEKRLSSSTFHPRAHKRSNVNKIDLFSFHYDQEVVSSPLVLTPALTHSISSIQRLVLRQKHDVASVESVIKSLQRSLSKYNSQIKLTTYGSYASNLWTCVSDIDLSISLSSNSQKPVNRGLFFLERLSYFLRPLFHDVTLIPSRVCPIIKLSDPASHINIDLSVDSTSGITAAQFIKTFLSISSDAIIFIKLIKYWGKVRQLIDSVNGGFTSFAMVLICIKYLQSLIPAVLPSLDEVFSGRNIAKEIKSPRFQAQCKQLRKENRSHYSISELVGQFFLYLKHFNFSKRSVCLFNNTSFSQSLKILKLNQSKFKPLVIVHDPLDLKNNAARALSKQGFSLFKSEVERSVAICSGIRDEDLFCLSDKPLTSSRFSDSIGFLEEFSDSDSDCDIRFNIRK